MLQRFRRGLRNSQNRVGKSLDIKSEVGKIPNWMEPVASLKTQEATDLLRHCLEDGEIIPGRHFRDELRKEGITIEDAWAVLRSGRIYQPPEPDIKTREWKYRLEGYEPGGKWMAIVFSFKSLDRVFLITVFSIELKRSGA